MDYAMPVAWRRDRREFWTKRKKTALSLVAVLAILAGIAAAFKLFDQLVPNNVVRDASTFSFEIWKRDEAAGDTAFIQTGPSTPVFVSMTAGPPPEPIEMFPGDTREVEVKIINTNNPARDASFNAYADAIVVKDATGATPTDPIKSNQFLSFWTLAIDKEKILASGNTDVANEDDHDVVPPPANDNEDNNGFRQYAEACDAPLKQIQRTAPCKLGLIRKAGTSSDLFGGSTDQRYYVFKLTEADPGVDQSEFKGWTITFNLVFQARIPPEPESSSAVPVRER
jgi:hypothetical protein